MFDRLQAVEDRYDRLNELLSDPSIVNDLNKLREYSKEQSDIQDTLWRIVNIKWYRYS